MIRFAALCLMVSARLVMGLPATAQDFDCAKAKTQVDLTYCAGQDWLDADAKLTPAYKAAMDMMKQIDSGLDAGNQGAALALRDGQRAWISFRDATCAAEGWAYRGGSAEPMMIDICRTRVTVTRTAELVEMAKVN